MSKAKKFKVVSNMDTLKILKSKRSKTLKRILLSLGLSNLFYELLSVRNKDTIELKFKINGTMRENDKYYKFENFVYNELEKALGVKKVMGIGKIVYTLDKRTASLLPYLFLKHLEEVYNTSDDLETIGLITLFKKELTKLVKELDNVIFCNLLSLDVILVDLSDIVNKGISIRTINDPKWEKVYEKMVNTELFSVTYNTGYDLDFFFHYDKVMQVLSAYRIEPKLGDCSVISLLNVVKCAGFSRLAYIYTFGFTDVMERDDLTNPLGEAIKCLNNTDKIIANVFLNMYKNEENPFKGISKFNGLYHFDV